MSDSYRLERERMVENQLEKRGIVPILNVTRGQFQESSAASVRGPIT